MKSLLLSLLIWCCVAHNICAQPRYAKNLLKEQLNRGLVVLPQGERTFVSWRYFEADKDKRSYRLYKNGVLVAQTQATNVTLPLPVNTTDVFCLKVCNKRGKVLETSPAVSPWSSSTLAIALTPPQASLPDTRYSPNDCSVGDVDGDGEYEIILKWDPSNSHDNSRGGKSDCVFLDCYKLSGKRLWRINLGLNIRAGAHYTQFLVYDFDGDGKAELMCKTAPGSLDARGHYVNEVATDAVIQKADNHKLYGNAHGHILAGPEYLTAFSGLTGEALHTVWYNPSRQGTLNAEGRYPDKSFWGDRYGNRSERYLACVAYLDGCNPSAVFVRGYYTCSYFWAVNFKNNKIETQWLHASVSPTQVYRYDAAWNAETRTYSSNTARENQLYTAFSQGNHNICVADVDGDGCDEITCGSAAIDNDGWLLYSTGLGHGDAGHLSDLVPQRKGLEFFDVHEAGNFGFDLRDAATGEILHRKYGTKDTGRGVAADIDSTHVGAEYWSTAGTGGPYHFTDSAHAISMKQPSVNFRIYWNGDLSDELLNASTISHYADGRMQPLVQLNGVSCNGTKATPNLSADILGDWREEVILHDDTTLYIHTTTIPTLYRVPALMTDVVYRLGVAWQNVSYNQPPHLSYDLRSSHNSRKQ